MSITANSSSHAPTSNRKKIQGANATYRASVQKAARGRSSTSPAKNGNDKKETVGQGSAPVHNIVQTNGPAFGSGHYTPNK